MSALTPTVLPCRPARCQLVGGSRVPTVRIGGCKVKTCRPPSAMASSYLDRGFIDTTIRDFTSGQKAVASPHEAMCLFRDGGYTVLDVRSELAFQNVGKIAGAINIPIIKAKRRFDSASKKNVVSTEELPDFVQRVQARYPDKMTKFLVMCATGRTHSISALIALDEAGYQNLVGMKGGYNAWMTVWDGRFRLRDGVGAQSTGENFSMSDKLTPFASDDY